MEFRLDKGRIETGMVEGTSVNDVRFWCLARIIQLPRDHLDLERS